MKNSFVASRGLIIYSFIAPCPMLLIGIALTLSGNRGWWIPFILYAAICVILSAVYHNAYSMCRIDGDGIHNRHVSFSYEEIKEYRIIEIKLFEYSLARTRYLRSVIGIGSEKREGGFISCDTRREIIIPLSREAIEALKEHNKGNACIREITEKYESVICR